MDPNHFPEKISDRIFNQGDFTISTDTLKEWVKEKWFMKKLWTRKAIKRLAKNGRADALEIICAAGKERDKGVLTGGLEAALKDYNADEVVLLLRHGATFMPVHDNAWVYFYLFSLYYASSEWEEERLCMFRALVNANESLKDDIYPYLMHLDIEEVDLLHYLVDIGTNIFFIDEKGATLYSRARAEHGVYFARHLKARQQFVNPLFTTMHWRMEFIDKVDVSVSDGDDESDSDRATPPKRHRIE